MTTYLGVVVALAMSVVALSIPASAIVSSGGVYTATLPTRILDTRNYSPFTRLGTCFPAGCVTLGPGQSIDVQVTGDALNGGGSMPADTTAVVVQFTGTDHIGNDTFLTIYPTPAGGSGGVGGGRTNASNLNLTQGQTDSEPHGHEYERGQQN